MLGIKKQLLEKKDYIEEDSKTKTICKASLGGSEEQCWDPQTNCMLHICASTPACVFVVCA